MSAKYPFSDQIVVRFGVGPGLEVEICPWNRTKQGFHGITCLKIGKWGKSLSNMIIKMRGHKIYMILWTALNQKYIFFLLHAGLCSVCFDELEMCASPLCACVLPQLHPRPRGSNPDGCWVKSCWSSQRTNEHEESRSGSGSPKSEPEDGWSSWCLRQAGKCDGKCDSNGPSHSSR